MDYTLSIDSGLLELNQGLDLLLTEDGDISTFEDGSSMSIEQAVTTETIDLHKGSAIDADTRAFALTGTSVNFAVNTLTHRSLAIDSGTLSLNGTVVKTKKGFKTRATTGAYAISGSALNLSKTLGISLSSGTLAVTGKAVSLRATRTLPIDSGALLFDNKLFIFNYNTELNYAIDCVNGAFALTGSPLAFKLNRKFYIDSGTLNIVGEDCPLSVGVRNDYDISADSGTITLTGSPISYTLNPTMPSISLDSGHLTINEPYISFFASRQMTLSPCLRYGQSLVFNELTYQIEVTP